ncbi:metal-dependent hydrolase [Halogeometricum limi]|uniref:LexA-binding, inner membrane-associated putative hydrolase n=1 Tax=Halogeometricum limi TaxID=555875 RepID=A0A1I6I579_9EURY|nr:metal-dependent hydrolase [Halogeometricum limi]SFR61872.1 LexA-binding, inner membrane-associated putative hydrolase [Halogeometricum limi]
MPSTIVHLALAGLLAAALLGDDFDGRSLLVVFAFTALPDLDVVAEPFLPGAHRSLGHTFLLPLLLFAVLAWDTRRGAASLLWRRYGARGVKVAWMAALCLLAAGILPDLFVGGVNAFYPVHDRFYTFDGRLVYSTDRGWVQTFVELSPPDPKPTRTTANFQFRTVLDAEPTRGVEATPGEGRVERIFPVATTGFRFGMVLLALVVVPVRLWGSRLRRFVG